MKKQQGINVLSLFDGMGCGWIALKELGIKVNNAYASEIDKFAIAQTTYNFPDVVHLGSVTDVDVSKLEPIDLLIGGSPCMQLSFAGRRTGLSTIDKEEIKTLDRYLELKSGGFQFDGQSYLFWEYMRILNDIRKYNPNVLFLLENVEMGKKWETVFNEAIGIRGVHINAALVSAQNRRRIYWTNICVGHDALLGQFSDIPLPEDKNVMLKDVLEDEVEEKYYLSDNTAERLMNQKKAGTYSPYKFNIIEQPGEQKGLLVKEYQIVKPMPNKLGYVKTQKMPCLTSSYRYGVVTNYGTRPAIMEIEKNTRLSDKETLFSLAVPNKDTQSNDISFMEPRCRIRRLTPMEFARLQTIPEWYEWKSKFPNGKIKDTSASQIYKMCGNGWCVEVIKHIFSFMRHDQNDKENTEQNSNQNKIEQ
ncbi:DNA (cytosine-5-)-methyltransferase [Parabacteroides distasonis]|uniref:DNA (cytosine-5-)-methyltransferase n=1 Tax=Parabacteroides distasonis TaxID=823 RepID=UPI003F2560F9